MDTDPTPDRPESPSAAIAELSRLLQETGMELDRKRLLEFAINAAREQGRREERERFKRIAQAHGPKVLAAALGFRALAEETKG